ncbi:MAG: enoyl-CoA hydratase/isomerase family protein [Planctomycetes bacterium]|nr:enoyl-CoA hydratase/isomerase family protein [Planctomycetota bacterium]
MNNLNLTNFDVHRDFRGVLTAILNVSNQPVNVINESVMHDLDELLRSVEHDSSVTALVFRSGKESGFLAGADLHVIGSLTSAEAAQEICWAGQSLMQRLESLLIPTVAVINGVCLGGGLEFALACRHRIVVDDPRTKLGLPEVELGLLPGWGGTQRLPRLVGLSAALPMLLTGKKVGARDAGRIGLADVVCKADEVDAQIGQLIGMRTGDKADEHYAADSSYRLGSAMVRLFGGTRRNRGFRNWAIDQTRAGQWLALKMARRSIRGNSTNYPALNAILAAVSAGLGRGDGFAVEREEFGKLLLTETHKSLLGLFFQRERARRSETWVPGVTSRPRRIRKVGVLGGGVMGAGIAHWASMQGYEVVLKEINAELLDAGLGRIRDLFQESVRKHALSPADAATKIGAITATTDWRAFADVDLAVEAVTERLDIKQTVFRDLELFCPKYAILASNTSALSIRAIGEAIHDSHRILGLHFFNPVHRMQLVEVVRTPQSRDEDVAMLVDFVKKLGKVPLVTADSPGFVVNRILFPYLDEAVRLHCEGVSTDTIDRTMKRFGMPMGPLELLDQVGIDVAAHVADSLNKLSGEPSPTGDRLHEMASEGHIGRKSGRGFYVYLQDGKRRGRAVNAGTKPSTLSADDIRDRILLRLVNEAALCLHEGVVPESWMIDLGMVLGTGFAPFLGGPLRMCELQGFGEAVAKLEYFQKTVGPRFTPSTWLVEQIEHHKLTNNPD